MSVMMALKAREYLRYSAKSTGSRDGLRAQLGGFHQPQRRAYAKLAGRVGGGGDDAAPV
jgi:hypothetical protein